MSTFIGSTSRLSRIANRVDKYVAANFIIKEPLSDEDALIKERCESSFYEFVKNAWVYVEGREYIDGWHMQAMCEHLQAVRQMEIRNLICNLPPRMGKSTVFNVLFPAWCWTIDPSLQFFYLAYSEDLSLRDSITCRRLIASPWYKNLWKDKYTISRKVDNKHWFQNSELGSRISSSINGTITGRGGDIIIFDDPNNMSTVHSAVIREKTNDIFDFTLSSRYTREKLLRRVVVQQRTHINDLTGHILSRNDPSWIYLCLPMEFEPGRRAKTVVLPMSNGKIWTDPRKEEGELLFPQDVDEESLVRIKFNLRNDSYNISSQLQQRPSPAEGGILKAEWFQRWTEPYYPDFDYILQSWDTALTTGEMSCYSSCTTWGVFRDMETDVKNIMLLSLFKEKIEYPELRKAAIRLAYNYEDVYIDDKAQGHKPPHLILVEEKVNGYCILQDLMRANLPVMRFNPTPHGNKIARCRLVSHLIENGLVWLPTEGPSYKHFTQDSQLFLEAAINFPEDRGNKPTNDIIDSMSQAFIWLTSRGWVANTDDPQFETHSKWDNIMYRSSRSRNVWKIKNH